ncbi:hypothetical protein BGZ74_004541, partial [Mortierella antarctica]
MLCRCILKSWDKAKSVNDVKQDEIHTVWIKKLSGKYPPRGYWEEAAKVTVAVYNANEHCQ